MEHLGLRDYLVIALDSVSIASVGPWMSRRPRVAAGYLPANRVASAWAVAATAAVAIAFCAECTHAEDSGDTAVDRHTVALWLFDDPQYYNVTLTDAGPYQIDLRLDTGREPTSGWIEGKCGLVKGRFGGALNLPLGDGRGVTWPSSVAIPHFGVSYVRDRGNEVPEWCNLGYLDFTVEFWLKAAGDQPGPGMVFELRNAADVRLGESSCPLGLSALLLDAGRKQFILVSKTLSTRKWDFELAIPTDAAKLNDARWHHLAFTFTAGERQMRHFVDGELQPLPEKGTFLPLMGRLTSLRLGRDIEGKQELVGLLDEMRISDVVRYRENFTPPGSLSRNYGRNPPAPGKPNGPPLLFAGDRGSGPTAVEPDNCSYTIYARPDRRRLQQRSQDFDGDPGWVGVGNQSGECKFGYQPAGNAAGGAAKGELGGAFVGSHGAFYADPVSGIDLATDKLSASGKGTFVRCGDGDVLLGWFNRASYQEGGQFPDGIFLFLADKHRLIVNYVAGGQYNDRYTEVATAKSGPFNWKLSYDPAGTGTIRLELGSGESATITMHPGEREAMGSLDHFGVVTRNPGGRHVLAFDDLQYTAGRPSVITAAKLVAPSTLDVTLCRPVRPESATPQAYSLSGPGRNTLSASPSTIRLLDSRTCRLTWDSGAADAKKDLTVTVNPKLKFDTVVRLGSRKHLFIDDALIEHMENVRLTANPPRSFQVTDFRCDKPWEPAPRFGPGIPDICSVFDDGHQLRMLYTNGGMWGGKPHCVCLTTSKDGLHWEKPELGVVYWEGSTENNIILRNASQGSALMDSNPNETPERRYKYIAWCMNRGFYVFTSPDCVHWRRNETLTFPFEPDGSIAAFWDDQCGVYRGYLRALVPGRGRQIARAEAREILKPWPFKPSRTPQFHVWLAPKPSGGELPVLETGGEVYRFKGIKYPWAPDAYLAFPWRHVQQKNVRPGSFLMTSRDGQRWRRYEPPYYFASGWELNGRKVIEALMEHGIVRRGDEIWQFGTVRFTEHGGALYGGVEHEGGYHDRLLRLVQRLDGFVSLDAGKATGTVTTRPLMFEGSKLELNIAASGSARVALLDESDKPLDGFGLDDCDPIQVDSVRQTVTWRGRPDVSPLAGKVVRVRFELTDAKLYAMQFVSGG